MIAFMRPICPAASVIGTTQKPAISRERRGHAPMRVRARPRASVRMDARSCGAHYLRYRSSFRERTFLQWLHGARFDPPTGM
ncbi:hypothetical protein WS86_07965 [Burkholderia savannae]|nr:hypothetical protein WS86_07965 [Burkholderia savannae]